MSNKLSWSQATHTLNLVGQQDPTPEHVKKLHGGALTDLVQAIKNGTLPPRDKVREFYGLPPQAETEEISPVPILGSSANILRVDYSQTLEQMIAAGHYEQDGNNWNEGITDEWFPITGEGIVEFEFETFHFGHCVSSTNAVRTIKDYDRVNPWEPAKMEHMLAYGAQFSKRWRGKVVIVGLGTSNSLLVPVLDVCHNRCRLSLSKWIGDWDTAVCFLAVRRLNRAGLTTPA